MSRSTLLEASILVTGAPAPGILVTLGSYAHTTVSDANGRFLFEPKEEWRLFWFFPLLPFAALTCHDELGAGYSGPDPVKYRRHSVEVNSCPETGLVGDRGERNRGLVDDLGIVRLKRFPERMP